MYTFADKCTSPQICNGVGTTPGKCVTPVAAGATCTNGAEGKLLSQMMNNNVKFGVDKIQALHSSVRLSISGVCDVVCTLSTYCMKTTVCLRKCAWLSDQCLMQHY